MFGFSHAAGARLHLAAATGKTEERISGIFEWWPSFDPHSLE